MKITRDEIAQNGRYRDSFETVQNTVAYNSMKSLVTIPYRSVKDTARLILMVCVHANRELSRAEICKQIKRKKTPSMVKLIEELVEAGHLIKHQHNRANGVIMFTYTAGKRVDFYGHPLPEWLD